MDIRTTLGFGRMNGLDMAWARKLAFRLGEDRLTPVRTA